VTRPARRRARASCATPHRPSSRGLPSAAGLSSFWPTIGPRRSLRTGARVRQLCPTNRWEDARLARRRGRPRALPRQPHTIAS
jgi:hypothetical protein